jgi:hypothetical protein
MRRLLLVVSLTGLFSVVAGPAIAAPELTTVPQKCHEWNALLHMDNLRSCDPPPTE